MVYVDSSSHISRTNYNNLKDYGRQLQVDATFSIHYNYSDQMWRYYDSTKGFRQWNRAILRTLQWYSSTRFHLYSFIHSALQSGACIAERTWQNRKRVHEEFSYHIKWLRLIPTFLKRFHLHIGARRNYIWARSVIASISMRSTLHRNCEIYT